VEGTSWSEGRADVVGIEREAIVVSVDVTDTHKSIVIVGTINVNALVALGALLLNEVAKFQRVDTYAKIVLITCILLWRACT
jgi:hypothetical protein